MNLSSADFFRLVNNRLKFSLYLFSKLPSAWFAGVRVRKANGESCEVTVPYKWFSQNPFRSTYFACLSMAAEMSTGILGMAHVYKSTPPVSMLVVKVEGEFTRKATGITRFTCNQGELIRQAIARAVQSGEAQMIRAASTGRNKKGEVVAEFFVTWSFKLKSTVQA